MDEYLLLAGGAWLVLQLLALWLLQGWWRKAAWLSAAVMGLAICVGVLGGMAGSNLAPIWIVFALPVCLSWIVGLWLVRALTRVMIR